MLDIPERDAALVAVGAPMDVRLNARPDRGFRGAVSMVGSAADPSTHTVKARGLLPNPQGLLKAEILVTVTVPSSARAGHSVPAAAVLLPGDTHIVFVDEGNGRLRRNPVVVGAGRDGRVPILGGLASGARIVTGNALLLEQLFASKAGA